MDLHSEIVEDEESSDNTDFNGNNGLLSRMALNDNKAGMQGLDKEKINKIILENTVGSKFYENEKKKDAQVNARICRLHEQIENLTPQQINNALGQVNEMAKDLMKNRDLSKTIVHIDMDAFYASVEERDNPELKNKPMAVGGIGMLSTSNYLARRYGVRAAMPGFIAKKLCPELVIVPCNFVKYREVSQIVRQILSCYDPNMMPMSLDEAYLDISEYLKIRKTMPEDERTFCRTVDSKSSSEDKVIFGTSAEEVVNEIRYKIQEATFLTASAGIAPNTLIAKVASDMNKPNGQYCVPPKETVVMEFVRNLSIRKVGGIGKVTEKLLNAIGVQTCEDLYKQRALLHLVFSQTMSQSFLRISLGIGSTYLSNDSERKSISTERTFREISSPTEMLQKCEELCEALETDAKRQNIKGLTVTLKVKTVEFELRTRSRTLLYPISSKTEIYATASEILRQEIYSQVNKKLKLRLMGVGLSKLSNASNEPQQKSLKHFIKSTKDQERKTPNPEYNESVDEDPEKKCEDLHSSGANKKDSGNQVDLISETADISNSITNENSGYSNNFHDNKIEIEQANGAATISTSDHQVHSFQSVTEEKHCIPTVSTTSELCSETNTCTISTVTCSKNRDNHVKDDKNRLLKAAPERSVVHDILSKTSFLTCPLCNATFCTEDITLIKFNSHVDSCLNRDLIKEVIKQDAVQNSKTHSGRNRTTSTEPPRKRKKVMKKPSIHTFFK